MNLFLHRNIIPAIALAVSIPLTSTAQTTDVEDPSSVASGLRALEVADFDLAARSFRTAFEAGDPEGAFLLGRMLELGLGRPPNLDAAIGPYVVASESGSAAAKNRLGLLHMRGERVLQDYEVGAALICEAAELGDIIGAFNCGRILLEGRGQEPDMQRAIDHDKFAADNGHIDAMTTLARIN